MKKIKCYLLCLIVLFIALCYKPVYAVEYTTNQLFPVGTAGSVKTDKYVYNDIVYQLANDGTNRGVVLFGSIQNNKVVKTSVSVNILLFDSEQRNIGLLSYCSDKDIDSDYAGFKLAGSQASPFMIFVTDKYLAEGKSLSDISYIAVMDDNKYCQIGGYDKYVGMTISEIVSGDVNNGDTGFIPYYIALYFQNEQLLKTILVIAVGILLFCICGSLLTNLYKKMYAKTTFLAYLPIVNGYVASKMAFGYIVAVIFVTIYFLSCILFYFKISFLFYICNIVFFISLIVDIIKLITKKYDLLYFEPSIKVDSFDQAQFVNSNDDYERSESLPIEPVSSSIIHNTGDEIIDLNYGDDSLDSFDDSDSDFDDDLYNISEGDSGFLDDDIDNHSSGNNSDGESDLSKFFH